MNDLLKQILIGQLRHLITAIGAIAVAKGYLSGDQSAAVSNSILEISGIIMVAAASWWSKSHKQLVNTQLNGEAPTTIPGARMFVMPILLGFVFLVAAGCSTPFKSDKIFALKERGFGLVVSESAANQTPQVRLGFWSSVIQIIPTSTNGVVYAPKYADSFTLEQGLNPFAFGIDETTGTGDVGLYRGTNSVSKAIMPGVGAIAAPGVK